MILHDANADDHLMYMLRLIGQQM